MKTKIIDSLMILIKQEEHYDDENLAFITYALEGIFLTLTK